MSDTKWISVKERLPEDNRWVLVYTWEPEFKGDTDNGYFHTAQWWM